MHHDLSCSQSVTILTAPHKIHQPPDIPSSPWGPRLQGIPEKADTSIDGLDFRRDVGVKSVCFLRPHSCVIFLPRVDTSCMLFKRDLITGHARSFRRGVAVRSCQVLAKLTELQKVEPKEQRAKARLLLERLARWRSVLGRF